MTTPALSPLQNRLHRRAMILSRAHRRIESRLVKVLIEVENSKLHRALGFSSLFLYAVGALGMTEAMAYAFISVARKTREVPELRQALESDRLTVAKASRLVAALAPDNAKGLIEFAQTHTTRETEREVAKIRPRAMAPDRAKAIADGLVHLQMSVKQEVFANFQRASSLVASQSHSAAGFGAVLESALECFLDRHDPVRRAHRSQARRSAAVNKRTRSIAKATAPTDGSAEGPQVGLLRARRVSKSSSDPGSSAKIASPARRPLSAAQKHAVHARDGGRCTHIDAGGKRCPNERWLHIHHLKPVHQGGANDPANLTTLCSFHHDLVHQLSLPLEGQVNWVRARRVAYRTGAIFASRPAGRELKGL